VLPLAAIFGALNGWTLGSVAAASAALAGAHQPAATLVFSAVVLLGELWLGALFWAFRAWLDERGAPERVVGLLGSVIAAHYAVHRLVERSQPLAQDGSFGGEHALAWLTLSWVVAILLVAASNALSGTAEPARIS
jgi:hypothetical protein